MRRVGTWLAGLVASPLATAQIALVAHYELDETGGAVAADSSGNGNDGTYVGGVTLGQPGTCPASTAVELDGVDAYIDIPSSPSLDALVSDLTVAAWVNVDAAQLMRIFGTERPNCSSAGGWSYGPLGNGGIRFTTLGVQDFDQGSTVQTGVWHHVAVVFDANLVAHFYLDGQLQGTIQGNAPANPPSQGWVIGVLDLTCSSGWFDGRIDDVQVYSGSATDAEISFLFQNPCSPIGGGPIGTSYCGPVIPNSSGQSAVITATGSTVAAEDDVTLRCEAMPTNEFGYFLNSMSQGFVFPVPNSQGYLCVTGAVGRYNGSVFDTGSTGTGQLVLSLPNTPTPSGTTAIVAGETWNFQCWFRDTNPAPTSNFSDGVVILFD